MRWIEMFRIGVVGVVLAGAGCSPRGPEALRRGDAALAAGQAEVAIPLLERAVADLPGNAAAWNQLGLAYHATGRNAEAQKAYLRALNDDRNFFDAHFNLGALEYEQRHWREAEREFRTYLAAEGNRTNAAAWQMLGEALLGSGQLDSAERTLMTAAQMTPNDASIQNSLGLTLVARKKPRDAQARFVQAVRLDSQDPASRLNLAIVTQQLGDRRASLEHYRAYLALNPTGPEVEGVRELVRQLEAQLAPPLVVTTNRVPTTNALPVQVTRTPPRAPTNATVAVAPRMTNPPTTPVAQPPVVAPSPVPSRPPSPVVATASPATNPVAPRTVAPPPIVAAPVPPPEVPLEVVPVEDEPVLKPARDVVAAPVVAPRQPAPVSTAVAPTPAPQAAQAPASQDAAPSKGTPPPTVAATAEADPGGKKNFWQKVSPVNWGNPVKWFRSSEGTTNTPATLAKAQEKPVSPAPSTNRAAPVSVAAKKPATAPAVPTVAAPPPKPVVPRYPRRSPPVVTPGNRAAAEAQARLAEAAVDNESALAAWQRAVQQDPSWTAAWMETGRVALDTSNVPTALLAGEAVTTLEPASAPAQKLFAAALARGGYPRDAAEHLEKAVAIAPGNAGVHLALAGIYARDLGEPGLARPHYEEVLTLDPKHPQAAAIRVWLASNP